PCEPKRREEVRPKLCHGKVPSESRRKHAQDRWCLFCRSKHPAHIPNEQVQPSLRHLYFSTEALRQDRGNRPIDDGTDETSIPSIHPYVVDFLSDLDRTRWRLSYFLKDPPNLMSAQQHLQ